MTEPFLGEIRAFGFDFTPRGWAACDGQLLQIMQYQALYSLIGTKYGGDGRTTFGLPDLRGCAPIHQGQGPGLSFRPLGARRNFKEDSRNPGDTNVAGLLTVNYCIALSGVFPSRN